MTAGRTSGIPPHKFSLTINEVAMLSITREFRFEAAHHLSVLHLSPEENQRVFGSCSKIHGHSYRLQVTVCGIPDEHGWLLDFSELKSLVQRCVLDDYDHVNLNILDDFRDVPPTAENMAVAIFRRLKPHCHGEHYRLFRVSVFETPDAWATWEEDHADGI